MILPDTSILLYAVDETSRSHRRAKAWLDTTLSGTETVGLAWSVLLGFVRLSTSSRVFSAPLGVGRAFGIVDEWLSRPTVTIVHPGERHLVLLAELLKLVGTAGNLVNDAHLGALAIEHGASVASADHDFLRFPAVRLVNPLATT